MTFQETKTDLRNPLLPSLTSHHQGNTAWSPIHYGPLYVSKNTNLTACTYPQLGLPCSSFFPLQLFPHKPQCYLAVKNMKKKTEDFTTPTVKFFVPHRKDSSIKPCTFVIRVGIYIYFQICACPLLSTRESKSIYILTWVGVGG